MTYEELSKKVKTIAEFNEERLLKNGAIENKIANVLSEERVSIVNDILDLGK